MKKWWIEREGENFEHVSADVLDVEAGTLVFKRHLPRDPMSMHVGDMPAITTLIVAAGTYKSVSLDQDVHDELFKKKAAS